MDFSTMKTVTGTLSASATMTTTAAAAAATAAATTTTPSPQEAIDATTSTQIPSVNRRLLDRQPSSDTISAPVVDYLVTSAEPRQLCRIENWTTTDREQYQEAHCDDRPRSVFELQVRALRLCFERIAAFQRRSSDKYEIMSYAVSIEGIPGAGKSTLIAALAKHLGTDFVVAEPIDEWTNTGGVNILEALVRDDGTADAATASSRRQRPPNALYQYAIMDSLRHLAETRLQRLGVVIQERSLESSFETFARGLPFADDELSVMCALVEKYSLANRTNVQRILIHVERDCATTQQQSRYAYSLDRLRALAVREQQWREQLLRRTLPWQRGSTTTTTTAAAAATSARLPLVPEPHVYVVHNDSTIENLVKQTVQVLFHEISYKLLNKTDESCD